MADWGNFDKGNILDVIDKWGGKKQIVIAEKTFKDTKFMDIRLYDGDAPKSGITLSYRDEMTEVKQLYMALGLFLQTNHVIAPPIAQEGESIEGDDGDPF